MKLHVKKGDNVKIIAGKDKGKTGKIIAVNPDTGRIVVDNANIIIKHQKAKSQQQQSAIRKMPGSIDSSNVQIVCPSCNKTTRVAKKPNDKKGAVVSYIRACKKCNASLDIKQKRTDDKKSKKGKAEEVVDKKATAKADKSEKVDKKDKGSKGDGVNTKNADGAIV